MDKIRYMDTYKEKYEAALGRAKELIAKWVGKNKDFYLEDYSYIFPELAESDDERMIELIRRLITNARDVQSNSSMWQQYDAALAWLEKQKEPENTSASTMIPSCWAKDPDKCPEFCVRSHCLGCPNYGQKEQKPAEWSKDFGEEVERVSKRYPEVSFAKLSRIAKHFAEWAVQYKPAEWSEEDELMLGAIIRDVMTLHNAKNLDELKKKVTFLKSLRPSWKPSEEQKELKPIPGVKKVF